MALVIAVCVVCVVLSKLQAQCAAGLGVGVYACGRSVLSFAGTSFCVLHLPPAD